MIQLPTEPRRDRWNRYLVVPPEGGKPIGYTRATTIAKTLDDQSNLINWRSRMTAIGLANNPDLLALVHNAADDKKKLDDICERAAERGGATARRDLGTAVHGILEQTLRDPGFQVPAIHQADIDAIRRLLDTQQLEVLPGMIERQVVLDEHKIAGTFDLLLRSRDGACYIADLKTGANVQYGALGFAIQLAIYAHADNLYQQGAAKDGSEDQRLPMPKVSRSSALIIHCEPGSGQAELHNLDLVHGYKALEMALEVRSLRGNRMIMTTVGDVKPKTTSAVKKAQDKVRAEELFTGTVSPRTRAQELRARARAACEAWPDGIDELRRLWPQHVPPLTDETHRWKTRELDDLEQLIAGIERRDPPLPCMYADGKIMEQQDADDLENDLKRIDPEADEVLQRIEREILPLNLLPRWDDQDTDRPLRELPWWRGRLFVHITDLFDLDCIIPILNACADHVSIPANPKIGLRILKMTGPQINQVLDHILHHGVLLDTDTNGNLVAHLNNPTNTQGN